MSKNNSTMHLVRAARQKQNLTREGLAYKAGLTVRTIERIEAGQVMPHRVTRRAIAAVLDMDPDHLWPQKEAA